MLFRSASRDGTALSALMIDIDHFKKFNDRYGHQAGDSCLRAVAGVLAMQARRPGDLAARYGGEEFALLLPDTNAEGCEQVGIRVRDALHDLQIQHGSNLPSGVVTASLGGATAWPKSAATTDWASLVGAADRALYSAKDGGRDRLVMSGRVLTWPRAKIA